MSIGRAGAIIAGRFSGGSKLNLWIKLIVQEHVLSGIFSLLLAPGFGGRSAMQTTASGWTHCTASAYLLYVSARIPTEVDMGIEVAVVPVVNSTGGTRLGARIVRRPSGHAMNSCSPDLEPGAEGCLKTGGMRYGAFSMTTRLQCEYLSADQSIVNEKGLQSSRPM